MTAIARRRAEALGLRAVDARVLDLKRIDEPDDAFDVVLCREGLMLVPDPVRAAREIRRVLRPGGRWRSASGGPRAANPWLGLVFDAVSAQLGAPMPPPGVPRHPLPRRSRPARRGHIRGRARRRGDRRAAHALPSRHDGRVVVTDSRARRSAGAALGGAGAGAGRAVARARGAGSFPIPRAGRAGLPGGQPSRQRARARFRR